MHRLIRWYNQNRSRFWKIVITSIIVVAVLYFLLNIFNDNLQSQGQIDKDVSNIDTNALESITMPSQKSAITGNNASISQDEISIIDNFMSYCNSQKIQEAYNLLSDECKSLMYPTEKDFQQLYYDSIFGSGKKTIEVENWFGSIYKIDFYEDFILSGKSSNEKSIQDYISIVKDENNNYKLNINKYLWTETLGVENNENNITMKVLKREVYMDYEIYTFELKNNSNKEISLGDIQYMDASYLLDKNELQYNACVTEISPVEIVCEAGETKNVSIKYFNRYNSTREITAIIFPKVILHNDVYKMISDKDKYNNYAQITINL